MSIESYTSLNEDVQVLVLANANRESVKRLKRLVRQKENLQQEIEDLADTIEGTQKIIDYLQTNSRISIKV